MDDAKPLEMVHFRIMFSYKLQILSQDPPKIGFQMVTRLFYGVLGLVFLTPFLLGWPYPWPMFSLPGILILGALYEDSWSWEKDLLIHRHGLVFLSFSKKYTMSEIKDFQVRSLGKTSVEGGKFWPKIRQGYVLRLVLEGGERLIEIRKGKDAEVSLGELRDLLGSRLQQG